MAADNQLLGQFDLVGIPPARRGTPQIEVAFDIDANGIVNVSAKDKASGKEQAVRIQASGGLTPAEIQRMVEEAKANEAADQRRRRLVEARNHAEGLIHTTKASLDAAAGRLPADLLQAAGHDLEALQAVLDGDSPDVIQSHTEALAKTSMRLEEALRTAAAGGGGGGPTDGAIDADFQDVA